MADNRKSPLDEHVGYALLGEASRRCPNAWKKYLSPTLRNKAVGEPTNDEKHLVKLREEASRKLSDYYSKWFDKDEEDINYAKDVLNATAEALKIGTVQATDEELKSYIIIFAIMVAEIAITVAYRCKQPEIFAQELIGKWVHLMSDQKWLQILLPELINTTWVYDNLQFLLTVMTEYCIRLLKKCTKKEDTLETKVWELLKLMSVFGEKNVNTVVLNADVAVFPICEEIWICKALECDKLIAAVKTWRHKHMGVLEINRKEKNKIVLKGSNSDIVIGEVKGAENCDIQSVSSYDSDVYLKATNKEDQEICMFYLLDMENTQDDPKFIPVNFPPDFENSRLNIAKFCVGPKSTLITVLTSGIPDEETFTMMSKFKLMISKQDDSIKASCEKETVCTLCIGNKNQFLTKKLPLRGLCHFPCATLGANEQISVYFVCTLRGKTALYKWNPEEPDGKDNPEKLKVDHFSTIPDAMVCIGNTLYIFDYNKERKVRKMCLRTFKIDIGYFACSLNTSTLNNVIVDLDEKLFLYSINWEDRIFSSGRYEYKNLKHDYIPASYVEKVLVRSQSELYRDDTPTVQGGL